MNSIRDDERARIVPRLSLTPAEAAQCTGFSVRRIFKAIEDERLTARKDGKATIIETEELARWLRALPTRGRQPDSTQQHAA
jgi:excisionase family DNA binding protein